MKVHNAILLLLFLMAQAAFCQPEYNIGAGFHREGFFLNLQNFSGLNLRYTLDGSIPDSESSLWGDSLWVDNASKGPNLVSMVRSTLRQEAIEYKAWEEPKLPLEKAQVLRLAEFRDGHRSGPVFTRTDFVLPDMDSRFSLPVFSVVTDSLNLFSFDSGIYVPGKLWNSSDPQWSGNYFMKGSEWERAVHVSYYTSAGELLFSQDAGLRIHGGMTRQASQKSLRFYAREEYGRKYFDAALFPGRDLNRYKRFVLQTTMGSWDDQSIIKDVLVHELSRNMEVEIMDFQAVIVYLNGEYWGIHTLRERMDERYISYLSAWDKDSLDLISGNWNLVEAGSNEHYLRLAEFIVANDLSEDAAYAHVSESIDLDSFIDYLIIKMYIFDRDWPENNQELWRPQVADGRWRWILTDLDAGFPEKPKNMMELALGDGESNDWRSRPVSCFLFEHLLKNGDFEDRYLRRWVEVLDHEFNADRAARIIDSLSSLYGKELPSHMDRWNYPRSLNGWKQDLSGSLYGYLLTRKRQVVSELKAYFGAHELLQSFGPLGAGDLELLTGPNPSGGYYRLHNHSDQSFLGELLGYDLSGRLIFKENYVFVEAGGATDLFLPVTGSGTYLLKFMHAEGFQVFPLVVIN